MTVGRVVLALGLAIVALTCSMWVALAAVAVLGHGASLTLIANMTMLQRRTAHGLMGRGPPPSRPSWVCSRQSC